MLVLVCVLLVVASRGIEFLSWCAVGSLGAALGWVLGIYISPASPEEASQFNRLGTVVASLVSGAVVTHLGALWQKLIEGAEPRILQRRYAVPVLIFLGTGLMSIAAQYNVRAPASPAVVVGLQDPTALTRDPTSQRPVLDGQKGVQFVAMVSFPDDAAVDEWHLESDDAGRQDIQDGKVSIDPKLGRLASSL